MAVTRRAVIGSAAAFLLPTRALARAPEIYMDAGGLFGSAWSHAVDGHDVVAYHALAASGDPVRGSPDYAAEFNGVVWLFASAENRDAFNDDPDKFRPKYGGYCAWAMARDKLAKGDPRFWNVHEGNLYLNVGRRFQREFLENLERDIQRADANWPGILDRN